MKIKQPCDVGMVSACLQKVADLKATSAYAQRQRVLALLIDHPASTFELRDRYNVMMPGARVIELREQGHEILTERRNLPDRFGRIHPRVAVYVLVRLAQQKELVA